MSIPADRVGGIGDRRPRRVHRPQRDAAPPGGAAPGAPVRPHRRRARPLRGDPGGDRAGAGQGAGDRLPPRHGPQRRTRPAQLVQRYRGSAAARAALAEVDAHWRHALGAVQVEHARSGAEPAGQRLADVPDPRLPDVGAQRLLPVRRGATASAISCRTRWRWSTPGPRLLREHLLLVRQPPVRRGRRAALVASAGRARRAHAHSPTTTCGCRSRCAATCRRPATPACSTRQCRSSTVRRWRRTRSRGTTCPGRAAETASAVRALRGARFEHGLRYGAHGLPLIGAGDWNDGMNRVGDAGPRRERLARLLPVRRAARVRAAGAPAAATSVRRAMRRRARRPRRAARERRLGRRWYRRAYFDDGTPLGSADSAECRIDSLAQSWAVLSGVGSDERVRRAMDAVATHLVRAEARPGAAARPAVRPSRPEPGLHQGLRARRARERRAVHPRRGVGGDGLRRTRRRAARLAASWT